MGGILAPFPQAQGGLSRLEEFTGAKARVDPGLTRR